MWLKYKLNNGKQIKLFDWGILECERNNKDYYRKVSEYYFLDKKEELSVDILKDESNRFYFEVDGERIYVSDYEYLNLNELIESIKNETITYQDLVASLIKNKDKIAFIEKRWVPDLVTDFGLRTYSNKPEFAYVTCIPTEEYYIKENWNYKIESIPLYENDRTIYGVERYYTSDFYSMIMVGSIKVVSLDEVKTKDNVIVKKK